MRRYGSGYAPKREDPDCCVANVSDNTPWPNYHQCRRKRGYGKDGLLCKQHAARQEQGQHVFIPEDRP
jgi:hypothetical protein